MLLALCVLLAGCDGSEPEQQGGPQTLPACARPAEMIPRPAALPSGFPVPAGTVFTKAEKPFPEQHVLSGISPGSLETIRSFYKDGLDEAGYEEGPGESEPGETEALFSGRGVRGGWRANVIPKCDGAVRLTLVIVRP
jgi:hypothetical protein